MRLPSLVGYWRPVGSLAPSPAEACVRVWGLQALYPGYGSVLPLCGSARGITHIFKGGKRHVRNVGKPELRKLRADCARYSAQTVYKMVRRCVRQVATRGMVRRRKGKEVARRSCTRAGGGRFPQERVDL